MLSHECYLCACCIGVVLRHSEPAAGLDCATLQPVNATFTCTPSPAAAQCDAAHAPAPTTDTRALQAWKASVTTTPDGPLASWSGDNACTWGWAGVECDGSGQVVGLRLKGMQLTGHANVDWQALANLTGLRTLELPVSSK